MAISVTGITLNKSTTTLYSTETETLIATIAPSDATNKSVTWTSSNSSVAIVDSSGKITAISSGSAGITVKTVDGNKVATCVVTVLVSVTGLVLNKYSNWNYENKTIPFYGNVLPTNASNRNIHIETTNDEVCTIDSIVYNPSDYPSYNFKVTLKTHNPGDASIYVMTDDGSFFQEYFVTVRPNLSGLNIVQSEVKMGIGDNVQLEVDNNGQPINQSYYTLSWGSSNIAAVDVDTSGLLTGLAIGNALITVTSGPYIDATGSSTTYRDTCTVIIYNAVKSITLNKSSTTLYKGETETLIPTILPSNANNKNVTWKSSNTNVAIVDFTGKITAINAGTATITATTQDMNITASCSVDVLTHVESISLSPNNLLIYSGDNQQLTPIFVPENASNKNIIWESSNEGIARVNNGIVYGVDDGTCIITARSVDGNKIATANVQIILHVRNVIIDNSEYIVQVGGTLQLFPIIIPENAYDKSVTWSSSDESIATIDQQGIVTGLKPGYFEITLASNDGDLACIADFKVNSKPTVIVRDYLNNIISNNQIIKIEEISDFEIHLQYFDEDLDEVFGTYIVKINGETVIDRYVKKDEITEVVISKYMISSDSINLVQIYAYDGSSDEILTNYFYIKYLEINDISFKGVSNYFKIDVENSIKGLADNLNVNPSSLKQIFNDAENI